jgi:hypothetical protein
MPALKGRRVGVLALSNARHSFRGQFVRRAIKGDRRQGISAETPPSSGSETRYRAICHEQTLARVLRVTGRAARLTSIGPAPIVDHEPVNSPQHTRARPKSLTPRQARQPRLVQRAPGVETAPAPSEYRSQSRTNGAGRRFSPHSMQESLLRPQVSRCEA